MSTADSSVSADLKVDNVALNGESYYLSWWVGVSRHGVQQSDRRSTGSADKVFGIGKLGVEYR